MCGLIARNVAQCWNEFEAAAIDGVKVGVQSSSWLLFLDESGHDHKAMPYEVRGGVAIHSSQLWPFIQGMQRLELDCFGCPLALYKKELKGSTLLDKKRFRFAHQDAPLEDETRRRHSRGFLTKGLEKKNPTRLEFSSPYGQACLETAKGIMQLLLSHKAVLFAAVVPRGIPRSKGVHAEDYLRKDHVFLLERFFYLLEQERKYGLLVMDEEPRRRKPSFCATFGTVFHQNRSRPVSSDVDRSQPILCRLRHELCGASGRCLHLLRELGISPGRYRHEFPRQAGNRTTVWSVAQPASISGAGLP